MPRTTPADPASIQALQAAYIEAEQALRDYAGRIQIAHEDQGHPQSDAWTSQELAHLRLLAAKAAHAWRRFRTAIRPGTQPPGG